MPIHTTSHPLIAHKLTKLRDTRTAGHEFREVLKEITFYLGYEASRDLTLQLEEIMTPMNVKFNGSKLKERIAIIPILRAGLGMSDALLQLIPSATVHHIGMYRSKNSLLPIQYYNRLPRDKVNEVAFVVDPCIATSNTIHAVVAILKRWGSKKIIVIAAVASRYGVDKLLELHPDISIFVGAIDETLSDSGMILPGIGDAGDRLFGTPHDSIPSLIPHEPLSPILTKRKSIENDDRIEN